MGKDGTYDPVDSFGELVAARRVQIGWTQQQLAGRAGVAVSTLSAIESGGQKPRIDAAARIATALGMHFDLHGAASLPAVPAQQPPKPRGRPRKS